MWNVRKEKKRKEREVKGTKLKVCRVKEEESGEEKKRKVDKGVKIERREKE